MHSTLYPCTAPSMHSTHVLLNLKGCVCRLAHTPFLWCTMVASLLVGSQPFAGATYTSPPAFSACAVTHESFCIKATTAGQNLCIAAALTALPPSFTLAPAT
eukprot:1158318-Pelagomonas_calceolata.AAC.8